jgi:hypothetical protein
MRIGPGGHPASNVSSTAAGVFDADINSVDPSSL